MFAQETIPIADKSSYQNLGRVATWWIDSSAVKNLEAVRQEYDKGQFKTIQEDIPSYGIIHSALWMHTRFQNSTGEKTYLIIENPNIDSIDIYVKHNGTYQLSRLGSKVLPDASLFTANLFSFSIPASKDTIDIWIRSVTHTSMIFPASLGTSDGVINHFLLNFTLEGVFAGIVFALFLYNLCLFIWTRDKNYGYYIGYLLFLCVYVLFYIRGFSHFWGEEAFRLMNRYGYSLAAGGNLFALLFAYSFLKVDIYAPSMVKLLKWYGNLLAVYIVFNLLVLNSTSVLLIQLVGFTLPLIILLTAIKVYRKGYKPAIFFISAWGFLFAGVLLYTASISSLIPAKPWTFHFVSIGASIEMIMLSMALGYRIVLLEKEKNQLQQNTLELIRSQNNLLEEKVNERTIALQESNHVKNKILSIIAHDIRTPFSSLESLLFALDNEMIRPEDSKLMFEKIRQNAKNLSGSLNNLLSWSLSQMNMISTTKERLNLNDLVVSVTGLYTDTAIGKKITLLNQTDETLFVSADQNQLRLIIRNLVENAIKFSYAGGTVKIGTRASNEKDTIEIFVSDEGKGISPDLKEKIFNKTHFQSQYGTNNEKGTGLGLQISFEFAALNGTELKVNTEEGKGTTFYFQLQLS